MYVFPVALVVGMVVVISKNIKDREALWSLIVMVIGIAYNCIFNS